MTRPLSKRDLQRLSRPLDPRNPTRQRLAAHLHAARPRPVLEALIAVDGGQPLDSVLNEFGRVSVETYHAIGANDFPNKRWRQ
jgi:hypothetical protein